MAAKISFFGNAQTADKKTKKKGNNKVRMSTDGLLILASIDAVQKTLKTLRDNAEISVKSSMRKHFVKEGVAKGHRPENYTGFDGIASASLELRKRGEGSALNDAQIAMLEAEGIEVETQTSYGLNQEVLTPEVMALLEKALNGVKGIPPNIFTVTSKTVVTEESLNQIFTKGESKAAAMFDIVATLATKPKVEEKFEDTLERVVELLKIDETEDK